MRLALLLMFVVYPLLELALLIRAGQIWGIWPVLATIIGTAILGVAILRRHGFRVAEKISAELNAGRAPVAPLADSGLVFAAGAFLVSPGLIGDTLGLLLLIPLSGLPSATGSEPGLSAPPRLWSAPPAASGPKARASRMARPSSRATSSAWMTTHRSADDCG